MVTPRHVVAQVEALADSLVGMHQHIDRLADLLPDGNVPLQYVL